MKARWGWMFCAALAVLLAGCFQQAGEAFQPANNTAEPLPLNVSNTPAQGGATAVQDITTQFPATATFPPITVISPPTQGAADQSPVPANSTSTTEGPLVFPQPLAVTDTPQFITPGGPPLPVPTNTPAPTLAQSATAASTPSGMITPTAITTNNQGDCTYTVQPGDNLFRIAVNHNTTVAEMRSANPGLVGDPPILQPGQVLQIPNCAGSQTADNVPAPTQDTGQTAATGGTTYTVKSGDTLFAIAQRFGVTVQAIVEANNLSNPNALSVGQQLVIPPPG